jgi:predicted dehydrogenase
MRALILGSGFAGQGHALALRDCGVEIAGMVSRTPDAVQRIATELDIPYAGTDWDQALADLQPDIVAIGTPGGAHFTPTMRALDQRCHVYCDKPLAASATDARLMYQKARAIGVKNAYAASYRYQPHVLLARHLVQNGDIGTPLEVECISHYNPNPLIPFGWSHRLEAGGGRLNNNFTHKLSLVLHILEGGVMAVNGSTRNDMPRAPVVSGVHDFRVREDYAPAPEELDQVEWRDADAEWSYTVMARIAAPLAPEQPVSALFQHSGLQPCFHSDYVAIYGSEATIFINGSYGQGPLYIYRHGSEWQEVPVPETIIQSLPAIEDDTQRNWTQLAREFVADIQGQPTTGYQTFRDGWIFQEIIEAVRAGNGWTPIDQDI